MECPKCNSAMHEIEIETLHGKVVIDKCERCEGLWFDNGEAEQLKNDWMADFADSGDPANWQNIQCSARHSMPSLRRADAKNQRCEAIAY